MKRRAGRASAVAFCAALGVGGAHAQGVPAEPGHGALQLAQASGKPQEPPPSPRFDISRFEVRGNTLLSDEVVAAATAPHTGKARDFGDVQRALEALQVAYQRRGYGTVQVLLPEQELEKGVVVLQVVETRIGTVTVEGNKHFDTANIRRSLPALKEGTTPNAVRIARQARVANENPSKNATVILRQSKREGEVDAVVRVDDSKVWRGSVSLDNTGTPTTGMYRVGVGLQHTNVDDRDHVLTFQYLTSPEQIDRNFDRLKLLGLGYRIPLYGLGDSIDLAAGYSTIPSALVQGLFNVTGSGTIFAARYNHMLARPSWLPDYEHTLTAGLDYRAYSNSVTTGGGPSLVPDVTVHPLSLTYTGTRRLPGAEVSGFFSVAYNFYPHGSDAYAEKFTQPAPVGAARGVGDPKYLIFRYNLTFARVLPADMQVRMSFGGQYTEDALIPGEQFGLGGFSSVRGMLERETAKDKGYRGSIELYSPDFGARLGLGDVRARVLAFVDWGRIQNNHTTPAECAVREACVVSATSVGFGLRLSVRRDVNVRLDYGHMLDGAATAEKNDDRVHLGVGIAF